MGAQPLARLALFALLLLTAACASPVGVDRRDARRVREQVTASVVSTGQLSSATRQLLHRLDLSERYEDEPTQAIAAIHATLGGHDTAMELLALSELSFRHAERSRDRAHFRAAAVYAYAFLFPDDGRPDPDPYSPLLRLAVELYNRGLARGLASEDGDSVQLHAGKLELPFGTLQLTLDEASLQWGGYRLHHFLPTAELEVRGLRNRYRRAGIGAPLAASVVEEDAAPASHRVPPGVRVPATAFVRFADLSSGIRGGQVRANLELYVMDSSGRVEVAGRSVPLEYEPTASLASMLEGARIWDLELSGFFAGDPNAVEGFQEGLFLLHPYHPGRVPVVLVHGTASSPARWAELINELSGDPELTGRIQVWLFMYTTGNPILFSGSVLREALRETVAELDPESRDPALQQMVVIGHSQGGLLTKHLAVDPGTRFWDDVSDTPLEELELSPETEAFVRRLGFFEPLPFLRRVVYVATPHHGSYLAGRRLAGFVSGLIELPGELVTRSFDLVRGSADIRMRRVFQRMPTSIDNMSPNHRFTKTLSSLREAPGVKAHSIIAVTGDGAPQGQSDGVVAYESAHIPGVVSELVVRSGHSTQANPHTVEEVRRILREHLRTAPVVVP